MAEEQKTQQEVELDTDGVNEEIINVDKPAEPDEAFSKTILGRIEGPALKLCTLFFINQCKYLNSVLITNNRQF